MTGCSENPKVSSNKSITTTNFQLDPTSPAPALFAILMALFSCFVLIRKFGPPEEQGRYLAIDGLRGYLAFCVFLHHSMIWFFFLRTNQWAVPPSNLYTHFGQTGVAFFFMITGFLFFSKILDGRSKEIDWLRLYVSRFLRLMPLYAVAVGALFLIVFFLSDAMLHEPAGVLASEILRWMTFTVRGGPDINGVERTSLIVAGVIWSLPYEWCFYMLLPIFALINQVRVGRIYIVVSSLILIFIFKNHTYIYHWLSFVGGIAAAYVVRIAYLRQLLHKTVFSMAAILLILATVAFFPSTYDWAPIAMLSAVFVVIAAGNGIFGLLTNTVSRALGELAYSIYLLHGIILFLLFRYVIGFEKSKLLQPIDYWLVIIAVSPILIFVSCLSYRKIERPALLNTDALTSWMRKKINSCSAVGGVKE